MKISKAFWYFMVSAQNGNDMALLALDQMVHNEIGINKNIIKVELYKKLGEDGNIDAIEALSGIYISQGRFEDAKRLLKERIELSSDSQTRAVQK